MEPIQDILVDGEDDRETVRVYPGMFRKGVLIEDELLAQAGILQDVQVQIENGKIVITSSWKQELDQEPTDLGWELWQDLGSSAVSGIFEDASENHDKYLYEEI